MCTDLVSVSINKCTATYTMYITAGINLLCHVHMTISILYIPIHTHTTPTCTWCPLNICLCCCQSSLFSIAVKFSCYTAPSPQCTGGTGYPIVYVLLTYLLLIITTVIIYSSTHIDWYTEIEIQNTSVHR